MLLIRCSYERSASVSRTTWLRFDHRARRVPLAGKRQQVAHDLRRALRLAQDRFETALGLLVDRSLREPLGPRQDRRERIVQLVRDAGNRLTERGELFRLQQLMIEIARLIFEPLALADVAHQRFDAKTVGGPFRVRGDFDPHRRPVGAAQAQQVVA